MRTEEDRINEEEEQDNDNTHRTRKEARTKQRTPETRMKINPPRNLPAATSSRKASQQQQTEKRDRVGAGYTMRMSIYILRIRVVSLEDATTPINN